MLMLGKKPVSPLCMPYAGIEKATNCLLEVPQNLKLTLENNVLTLKRGSVLVWGGDEYITYTTTQDNTRDLSSLSNGKYIIFSSRNTGAIQGPQLLSKVFSGDTLPTISSSIQIFYLTTDKTFHFNGGTQETFEASWPVTYPLCNIEVKDGVASFTKDDNGNNIIFNDFSIIGDHYIGYPNNNLALGCDGFNTDGSYKTTHIHRGSLLIFELPKTNVSYILHPNGTLFGGGYDPNSQSPYEEVNELPTTYVAANIYVKDENQIYRWSDSLKDYHIENNSLYYGYINLSSDGIFRSMAIQPPLTKYRWVVKLIP